MAFSERRQFKRILFDAPATVRVGQDLLITTLIDISLRGALITRPDGWPVDLKRPVHLDILLDAGETHIKMIALQSHHEADAIGLKCQHIDMESITHLRRLLELNLGDPALLERELEALG